MKRFLAGVGLAVLYCWATRHTTKRQFIGGLRCQDCKRAFFGMEDAGTIDDGYVSRTRQFSRANGGEFLRGYGWLAPDDRARRSGL